MKFVSLAFVAAMTLVAAPTLAADVTARDPQTVLDALKRLGYPATLATAPNGATAIDVTIDGSPSYVDFWNCDNDNTDCRTLMLVYGLDLTDGSTAEKANEWNADTIHGFVYLDKNNDPWLNLTVRTDDGISQTVFESIMRIWRMRIGDLQNFYRS